MLIDRTSHNLWPFELLLASAFSVALFSVFWALRAWTERAASRNLR